MTPSPESREPTDPGVETEREPTLAVALRRGPEGERARLTAKGRGALAEQILEVAFARGIKVRSDADLAQLLEAVELDSDVPLPALAAVAEILNRIYRANGAPEAEARG